MPNRAPGWLAALAVVASACTNARPSASASLADGTCVLCHGTSGRLGNLPGTDPLLPSAPPAPPFGKPTAVNGAHQAHLNPPSAGALRGPIACDACHVVPDGIAHATNPPASPVAFGSLARAQGNAPTFDPITLSCSATYCHGGFSYNGVRGTAAAPAWTDAWTGASTQQCVNCHGLPPTGHPALPAPVTAASCSACHPATVNTDGTINTGPTGGAHVNGQADVAGGTCTSCHGDANRAVPAGNPNALLPAAPPVPPPGAPAAVVGTHLLHLTDSAIRAAVRCNECHVVPANADHATQHPPVVVFSPGTLATTQGAAPAFDPTTLSCSATYCHGNFRFGGVAGNATATPAWNATPALACTGCHGMPPTGHAALSGTVTAATCSTCHPATVKPDGTIDVAGGKHMDGLAEYAGAHPAGWADPTQHGYAANAQGLQNCTSCHVAFGPAGTSTSSSCNACHAAAGHASWQTECTFCHGTPGRAPTALNPQLAAAPPVDSAGNTASTAPRVGAHAKHLVSPTLSSPFACGNCHESVLPVDVAHVDGRRAALPFGLLAVTGNVTPSYVATTQGCAATYCHGNFTNGQAAVPVWNVPSAGGTLACNACHLMPNTLTNRHSTHAGGTFGCSDCHSGIASGTGASNAAITGPASHVNGRVEVVFAPANAGMSTSGTGSSRTCTGSCHAEVHSGNPWTR